MKASAFVPAPMPARLRTAAPPLVDEEGRARISAQDIDEIVSQVTAAVLATEPGEVQFCFLVACVFLSNRDTCAHVSSHFPEGNCGAVKNVHREELYTPAPTSHASVFHMCFGWTSIIILCF